MNLLIDVFQALRAHLDKEDVDLAAHLVVRIVRHADAARLSQHLQASGDVDPVTEYVVTVDNDVAEVDANAEGNAPILGYPGGAISHRRLHIYRTPNGVDDARELQQQAVTGRLDDAATVAGNSRVHHFLPNGFQHGQRAALIAPHQAGV